MEHNYPVITQVNQAATCTNPTTAGEGKQGTTGEVEAGELIDPPQAASVILAPISRGRERLKSLRKPFKNGTTSCVNSRNKLIR